LPFIKEGGRSRSFSKSSKVAWAQGNIKSPNPEASGRVEKSLGVAIIAYLFLLRACREDIKPGNSWSIFTLQQNFRMRVMTNQIQHDMELKIKKLRKVA
jgi:hypothetical protein